MHMYCISLCSLITVANPRWILFGIAFWWMAAVLFGAPLLQKYSRTACWATLQSSLTFAQMKDWKQIQRLGQGIKPSNARERKTWGSVYGAGVGAWVGALPILLDWDRPWQAWPITITYGAALGFVGGRLIAMWVGSLNEEMHGR